jgi:hypothetical protein
METTIQAAAIKAVGVLGCEAFVPLVIGDLLK